MTTPLSDISLGRIVMAGEIDSALPLEHTEISAQVCGPLASVLVVQRFGNPLAAAAELEYLFPLAEGAAVVDFALRLGQRLIRAGLEELGQAREEYEEAREQGRRAGLLEQRRPNLFSVQLANLLPGETVQAEVRYQERLKFSEDGYEFVFPMGLTPKYDRPEHPEEGGGVHAPVTRPGERIGTVELTVAVDAGLACGEPSSPSHPLEVRRLDERRFQVRLAGEQIPDRDFVLRLPAAGELPAAAAWASPAQDGAVFLASVLPPRAAGEPIALRREFIFVLDRSGSMGGEPILQARNALRACLRSLNPGDTFRVLLFDDRLEWYLAEASPAEQAAVEQADAFLNRVAARGGTEIGAALEAALSLPPDSERTRTVVFLTDGAVSAESATLETLRRSIGEARIFTFGIGPSVNRALLNRMARQGRGASEFLQADEDIEGAILRFQDRVSFPALTQLKLEWQGGNAWDVYPQRLPDLYLGQPLEICGRLRPEAGGAAFTLRGMRGEEPFALRVEVPVAAQADAAVSRVWARARAAELLDEMELEPAKADALRAALIGLALEHRLATPYTAFVALDEEAVSAGKPLRVRVSQPLPQGVVFAGPAPAPLMPMPQAHLSESAPSMSGAGRPRAKASGLLRRLAGPDQNVSAFMAAPSAAAPDPSAGRVEESRVTPGFTANREQALRELARTQRMDGSWGGEVEQTAAALLAFVRAGHTGSAGSFRQAVRRAVGWLESHSAAGFAAWARARALQELGERGEPRLSGLAEAAWKALGEPQSELEKAAAGGFPYRGTRADSLDELRLAGWSGAVVTVAPELAGDPLARAWAAGVM